MRTEKVPKTDKNKTQVNTMAKDTNTKKDDSKKNLKKDMNAKEKTPSPNNKKKKLFSPLFSHSPRRKSWSERTLWLISPSKKKKQIESAEDEKLSRHFRSIDVDGSGKIDKSELRFLLSKCTGSLPTDDEVDEMMREVDRNDDGLVDYEEFKLIHAAAREGRLRFSSLARVLLEFDRLDALVNDDEGPNCKWTTQKKKSWFSARKNKRHQPPLPEPPPKKETKNYQHSLPEAPTKDEKDEKAENNKNLDEENAEMNNIEEEDLDEDDPKAMPPSWLPEDDLENDDVTTPIPGPRRVLNTLSSLEMSPDDDVITPVEEQKSTSDDDDQEEEHDQDFYPRRSSSSANNHHDDDDDDGLVLEETSVQSFGG